MTDRVYSKAKETLVTLQLNKQQIELLDRTIAQRVAPDRASLVRLALLEYAENHGLANRTKALK